MYKKVIYLFFSKYISWIIKRDFKAFNFNALPLDDNKAILLLANHFSWWDGFLFFHLNRTFFKKRFHVMVTEENYKKVKFLKYLGAFPVNKRSKRVFESLNYAGQLLNDPNNLVLVFPQGKLYSNHVEYIEFEKGLINLINSSSQKFQYLFAATFVDYFDKRKPAANCYLKTEDFDEVNLQLIEIAYNKHYKTSRQQQSRTII